MFDELQDQMGLTYLFIAHDLLVVRHISDRIAVMYLGKMVELADAKEIYDHPLHPYTRSLLSAIPLPDPEMEKNRVRIRYNPKVDHEYTTEVPEFREVCPGHFVRCTMKEYEKYLQQVKE